MPTGGVSYTVGGAAAPPTLSSAPPTFRVVTSSFVSFECRLTSGWIGIIHHIFNLEWFAGVKMPYFG